MAKKIEIVMDGYIDVLEELQDKLPLTEILMKI